jgi:aminopeptidase N
VFRRVLRRFADEHRFGKATIADFQRVVEAEAGQDLQWFFNQWLGRRGGISLTYSFQNVPSPGGNEVVLTVTQPDPPYRARMKVVFQVENAVHAQQIEISEKEHTFRFPVKGQVTNVLFDPDNTFLMKPPRWVVAASQ